MDSPTGPQAPPVGDASDLVAFSRPAADRVREAVRYYEQFVRQGKPRQRRGFGNWSVPALVALTGGGGIGVATSASAWTPGTVTLCDWSGTAWVPGSETVTALNCSPSAAVTANAYVLIAAVGGLPADTYVVVLDPC